jgi:hypothetical protein
MAKFTDTQLVILSTASRRDDRGVVLPTNVTGEALREAVDKLIRTGLLEEVRANGSLLAWRRDAEVGPMALRITKQGLEAIGVKDVAVGASTETNVSPAPDVTEIEAPAVNVLTSRKRASLATQTSVRTRHQTGKAKSKAGSSRESRPGSKQSSCRRDARPSRGGNHCCHHACDPLAAALGPRLLRRRGAQEAQP